MCSPPRGDFPSYHMPFSGRRECVNGCKIQRCTHFVKILADFFSVFSWMPLYYCKHVSLVVHNEQILILPHLVWTHNDLRWCQIPCAKLCIINEHKKGSRLGVNHTSSRRPRQKSAQSISLSVFSVQEFCHLTLVLYTLFNQLNQCQFGCTFQNVCPLCSVQSTHVSC